MKPHGGLILIFQVLHPERGLLIGVNVKQVEPGVSLKFWQFRAVENLVANDKGGKV